MVKGALLPLIIYMMKALFSIGAIPSSRPFSVYNIADRNTFKDFTGACPVISFPQRVNIAGKCTARLPHEVDTRVIMRAAAATAPAAYILKFSFFLLLILCVVIYEGVHLPYHETVSSSIKI